MIEMTKEQILLSALESPFQSYGGEELYPSIQAKAARLCYGLVKNHAMIDGMPCYVGIFSRVKKYEKLEILGEEFYPPNGKLLSHKFKKSEIIR